MSGTSEVELSQNFQNGIKPKASMVAIEVEHDRTTWQKEAKDGEDVVLPDETSQSTRQPKDSGNSGLIKKGVVGLIIHYLILFVIMSGAVLCSNLFFGKYWQKFEYGSTENATLYRTGTKEPVRVASTDLVISENGVLRERKTNKPATTAAVQSFAFLPELLWMPLDVIDSVEKLTFTTSDGRVHGLPSLGFVLDKGDAGDLATRSVTFFTPVQGTTVIVYAKEAFLVTPAPADAPVGTPNPLRLRIILPDTDDVNGRRLRLLENEDLDLSHRCATIAGRDDDGVLDAAPLGTVVCLHTREEVLHLHGHYICPETGKFLFSPGRKLETSDDVGVSYAELSADSYSIQSNSGYVSWAESVKEQRRPDDSGSKSVTDDGKKIEFDEWGCMIEDGYVTVGYPLTKKHCYRWQKTRDCNFNFGVSAITDYGYDVKLTQGLAEGFLGPGSVDTRRPGPGKEWEVSCDASVLTTVTGFCECGSGLKIKAGGCAKAGTYLSGVTSFKCREVCLEHARGQNELSIDLYERLEERLEKPLTMDSILTDNFFTVKAVNSNDLSKGVTASIQDGVYYSTRLAYRRETPTHYGFDDWPSWVTENFEDIVAAHYTPDSLSDDGSIWKDVSRHGRHAHVTNKTLEKVTLRDKKGPEKAIVVLEGKTGEETVDFDHSLIPSSVTTLYEGAIFNGCTPSTHCKDISDTVSATYMKGIKTRIKSIPGLNAVEEKSLEEQFLDFQSWWAQPFYTKDAQDGTEIATLGTNAKVSKLIESFKLPSNSAFEAMCQAAVVGDQECGEIFEIQNPSFSDISKRVEGVLDQFFAGLKEEPARLVSGNEWLKCAGSGEKCTCNGGTVRFAPATANAATLDADDFSFHTATVENTKLTNVERWARSAKSTLTSKAGAEIVHYYKLPSYATADEATKNAISCTPTDLIPTFIQTQYDANKTSSPASFTTSTWDCYCKDHMKLNLEARKDLQFNTQAPPSDGTGQIHRGDVFLFSDWEVYKPFADEIKDAPLSAMKDTRTVREIALLARPEKFRSTNAALCIVNGKNETNRVTKETCESSLKADGKTAQTKGKWFYSLVNPVLQYLETYKDGSETRKHRRILQKSCRCKVGAKQKTFLSKNNVRKSSEVASVCAKEHGHIIVPSGVKENDDVFAVCGVNSVLGVTPHDSTLKFQNFDAKEDHNAATDLIITKAVYKYPSCKPDCLWYLGGFVPRKGGEGASGFSSGWRENEVRFSGGKDTPKVGMIYKIVNTCYMFLDKCPGCLDKFSLLKDKGGNIMGNLEKDLSDNFQKLVIMKSCEYNLDTTEQFEHWNYASTVNGPAVKQRAFSSDAEFYSCPGSHPFAYASGRFCCATNKGYEGFDKDQFTSDGINACFNKASVECHTGVEKFPLYNGHCPLLYHAFFNGTRCCQYDYKDSPTANRFGGFPQVPLKYTDLDCAGGWGTQWIPCPSTKCAPKEVTGNKKVCKDYKPPKSNLVKGELKELARAISTIGYHSQNPYRFNQGDYLPGALNTWGVDCRAKCGGDSSSCAFCGTGVCCRFGYGEGGCHPTQGYNIGQTYCMPAQNMAPPSTFWKVPASLLGGAVWQSPIQNAVNLRMPKWYGGNGYSIVGYSTGLGVSCTRYCQRMTKNAATKCLRAEHTVSNTRRDDFFEGGKTANWEISTWRKNNSIFQENDLTMRRGWAAGEEVSCDWYNKDQHKRCWHHDAKIFPYWSICTQSVLKCLCQPPNDEPVQYRARVPVGTAAKVFVIKKKVNDYPDCATPGGNSCMRKTPPSNPRKDGLHQRTIPGKLYRLNAGTEWETCVIPKDESDTMQYWPRATTSYEAAFRHVNGVHTPLNGIENCSRNPDWAKMTIRPGAKSAPGSHPDYAGVEGIQQCQITPWENPFPQHLTALSACPNVKRMAPCTSMLQDFCSESQQAAGAQFFSSDCDMDGVEDYICETVSQIEIIFGSTCQKRTGFAARGQSWATECRGRSARWSAQPVEVKRYARPLTMSRSGWANKRNMYLSSAALKKAGFEPVSDANDFHLDKEKVEVFAKFVTCFGDDINTPGKSHCDVKLPLTTAPPASFNVAMKIIGDAAGEDEVASVINISTAVDSDIWEFDNNGMQTCNYFCKFKGEARYMKNSECIQARTNPEKNPVSCSDAHGDEVADLAHADSMDSEYASYNTGQCTDRNELGTFQTSFEDCKAMCTADATCISFEYGKGSSDKTCTLSTTCTYALSVKDITDKFQLYVKRYQANKKFDCLCSRTMRTKDGKGTDSGDPSTLMQWKRDFMKEGASCFENKKDASYTLSIEQTAAGYAKIFKETEIGCSFTNVPAHVHRGSGANGAAALFRGPRSVPSGTVIKVEAPPGTTMRLNVLIQNDFPIAKEKYGFETVSEDVTPSIRNRYPPAGYYCPSDICGQCTGAGVEINADGKQIKDGEGFESAGQLCCAESPIYYTRCPVGYHPYANGSKCCEKGVNKAGKEIFYDSSLANDGVDCDDGISKNCNNASTPVPYQCAPKDVKKTMKDDGVRSCFKKCPAGYTSRGGGTDWSSCVPKPLCNPTETGKSYKYYVHTEPNVGDFCAQPGLKVDKFLLQWMTSYECPTHCVMKENTTDPLVAKSCFDKEKPDNHCRLPTGVSLRDAQKWIRMGDKLGTNASGGSSGGAAVKKHGAIKNSFHYWKENGQVFAQVGRQGSTTDNAKGIPMLVFTAQITCDKDGSTVCSIELPKTEIEETLSFVMQVHKRGTYSTSYFREDKKWGVKKTASVGEPQKACCSGYDVASSGNNVLILGMKDLILANDAKKTDTDLFNSAKKAATIYTLNDADSASKGTRKGKYATLFHITRYGPNSTTAQRKRIFQNRNDESWFDGFDSGYAGVANHFGDFVTEQANRHPMYSKGTGGTKKLGNVGWVLSSSSTFSYRSNFVTRPLVAHRRTARSLAGVDLVINPDVKTGSPFQIAEVLVLHTDTPLSDEKVEDIERYLFRRNIQLFLRAQYTTDGFQEDVNGSSTGIQTKHSGLWHSTSLFDSLEKATIVPADKLKLSDNGQGGMTVQGEKDSVLTFPSYTIPNTNSGGEYTAIAVASFPSTKPLFSVQHNSVLTSCLRSGAASRGAEDVNGSTWDVRMCETRPRPVLRIFASGEASEISKSLVICEVEAYTQIVGNGKTNIALKRPSSLSSSLHPDNESKFGNDGNLSTCAITQIGGTRSFEVELDPGTLHLSKVRVYTKDPIQLDDNNPSAFTAEFNGKLIAAVVSEYSLNPSQYPKYAAMCPNRTYVYDFGKHCCNTNSDKEGKKLLYASTSCKDDNNVTCPAGAVKYACAPSAYEPEPLMEYGAVGSNGQYTFTPSTGSTGSYYYSVWLEGTKDKDGKNLPLTICEIEIYVAPSYLSKNNPNVALNAPVATSIITLDKANKHQQAAPAVVDGDPKTCITTKEDELGLIRVDLPVGAVPMRIKVVGRPAVDGVTCNIQKASINGAQLYVGTRTQKVSKISSPLYHICNDNDVVLHAPNLVRYTKQDSEMNFIEIHPNDVSVAVCEVTVFAKDTKGNETIVDLRQRSVFIGNEEDNNSIEALKTVDGIKACEGDANAANAVPLRGKVLKIGVPHGSVISRVSVNVSNAVLAEGTKIFFNPGMILIGTLGKSGASSKKGRRLARRLDDSLGCTPFVNCGWCSANWGDWDKNDFGTVECIMCHVDSDCPSGRSCWASQWCTASQVCGQDGDKDCSRNNHSSKKETPITCADPDANAATTAKFDCSKETRTLMTKPTSKICSALNCTAAECCTRLRRTCLDPDAIGNTDSDNAVDCAGHPKTLHPEPEKVRCNNKRCTMDLCCTVTPPQRTCSDRDADGKSDGTAFDCATLTSGKKLLDKNPSDIKCTEDALQCTAKECCTRFQRTCADPAANGISNAFDCSNNAKNLSNEPEKIKCAQEETCLESLCCTVTPIPRTCADRNALGGDLKTPFDCSNEEKAISLTPSAITCSGKECTATECCTVIRKTCANTNASVQNPVAFDCGNEAKELDAQPETVQCTENCNATTCCTVTPSTVRTCNDIDGDGTPTPYSCKNHDHDLTATPKDVKCADNGKGACDGSICCTVVLHTCANTEASPSNPKPFDCSQDIVNSLHAKPKTIRCPENTCSNRMCCTVPRPVDCVGGYGEYSTCSKTCGGGTQTRTYVITTPAAGGGKECPNQQAPETRGCNAQTCPTDCTGQWEEWGECSKPCIGGKRTRTYTVITPAKDGGKACDKSAGAEEACNSGIPCPTAVETSDASFLLLQRAAVFHSAKVSDEENYNASVIGAGPKAGSIKLCGAGGPKIGSAAKSKGIGGGQHYTSFLNSSPCDCQAKCKDDVNCFAWGFNRNSRSVNFKICYLSDVVSVLNAEVSLDYIGGFRPPQDEKSNDDDASKDQILTATFGSGDGIAEIAVLDVLLPPSSSSKLLEHIKRQYVQLFQVTKAVKPPYVTVNTGFMIQSQGIQWAIGKSASWEQKDGNFKDLTAQEKKDYGLSELTHSITAKNHLASYVTSKDMEDSCLTKISDQGVVTTWAFDPVSTTAKDNNVVRSVDSYGVEVESLALCRRMTTAEAALSDLPKSTVCGMTKTNGPNPTCQPTAIKASWQSGGVSFAFRPGCRAATHYQFVRNREEQIGSDFHKVFDRQRTPVQDLEHKLFCNTFIKAGMSHQDFGEDIMQAAGHEVEYCVRSVIPGKGSIVTSDWTCTSIVIGWESQLEVEVKSKGAGQPQPGVIIDTVLCGVDEIDCNASVWNAAATKSAWQHPLSDGGTMIAFTAWAFKQNLVPYKKDNTLSAACKFVKDNVVNIESDKPDFELIFDHTMGIAWYAAAPGCFLFVKNRTTKSFTVARTGGLQTEFGALGFGYHFRVERKPSWHFMATFCRDSCGLTGSRKITESDVFYTPFVSDLQTPHFCTKYKDRCPGDDAFESAGGISGEVRGAYIFGQDTTESIPADKQKVHCNIYEAEYAFFDKRVYDKLGNVVSGTDTYQCCKMHLPSDWDSCRRHFTKCILPDHPDARAVTKPSKGVQKRHFRVFIQTAEAVQDSSQVTKDDDLPWLEFTSGAEEPNSSDSVVLLVDATAAAISSPELSPPAADRAKAPVQIYGAWSGFIRQYRSVRVAEDGKLDIPVTDIRLQHNKTKKTTSSIRMVHVLPTRVSIFPSADQKFSVASPHIFKPDQGTSGLGSTHKGEIVKVLKHQIFALQTIVDITVVSVPVRVVHPDVGPGSSPSSCGVANVLMCAYTKSGDLLICETTNASGDVGLIVPRGMDIRIRNGCPKEAEDHVLQCGEEGIELNLDILNNQSRGVKRVGSAFGDATGRYASVTKSEAALETVQIFIEKATRHPILRLGAGRFVKDNSSTILSKKKEDAQYATVFALHPEILGNVSFDLKYTGPAITRGKNANGCDRNVPVSETVSQKFGLRQFTVRLPRDLSYEISVNVKDMISWEAILHGTFSKVFAADSKVSQKQAIMSFEKGFDTSLALPGMTLSQASGTEGTIIGILIKVEGLAKDSGSRQYKEGSAFSQAGGSAAGIVVSHKADATDAILFVTTEDQVKSTANGGGALTMITVDGESVAAGTPTAIKNHQSQRAAIVGTPPDVVVSIENGDSFLKSPTKSKDSKGVENSIGSPSSVLNSSGEATVIRSVEKDEKAIAIQIMVKKGKFTNLVPFYIDNAKVGRAERLSGEPKYTTHQGNVGTYLNSLPAIPVAADDLEPEMEFMFRKKATLKTAIQVASEANSLRECTRIDFSKLYGVKMVSDKNPATGKKMNSILFTISAFEAYATEDNGKEVQEIAGGLPKLLYVPGTIHTNDNMAFSTESRFSISGGIYDESKSSHTSTMCTSATGCVLSNILAHACGVVGTKPEEAGMVTQPADCQIAGQTLEGTFYQGLISRLSDPERYKPFSKRMEFFFTPSTDDLPTMIQVNALKTDTSGVDVVVEGDVPLTRNQAIKLPEYVPFVIIRDPPGDGSFTTWRKDTTMSVNVEVGFGKAQQESHEMNLGFGAAESIRADADGDISPVAMGFGGIGAVLGLEINVFDYRMMGGWHYMDAGQPGTYASDIDRVMHSGMEVQFTASTEYSTSPNAGGGVFQDLIVMPSLSILTMTALPIRFRDDDVFCNGDATCLGKPNSQCEGFAASEISTWSLIGDVTSEAAVKKKLDDYEADMDLFDGKEPHGDIMGNSLTSLKLRNYAVAAIKDDTWNAITVHTVYDIIRTRIPQLQDRCLEEWNDLRCNFADQGDVDLSKFVTGCGGTKCAGSRYFDDLLLHFKHYDATLKRNWCKIPVCKDDKGQDKLCGLTGSVKGDSCKNVSIKKTYTPAMKAANEDNTDATRAQARLMATLDAIKGWIRVLKLNEELKEKAKPVGAEALVASPLLQGEQGFSANPDAPGFYVGGNEALEQAQNGLVGSKLSDQLSDAADGANPHAELNLMFGSQYCTGATDKASCDKHASHGCYYQRYCRENCYIHCQFSPSRRNNYKTFEVTADTKPLTSDGYDADDVEHCGHLPNQQYAKYAEKCSQATKFHPKGEALDRMMQPNHLGSPEYTERKKASFRGGNIANVDPPTVGSTNGNVMGLASKSAASIVAFSGGGQVAKYSYTSKQTSALSLQFQHHQKDVKDKYMTGYWNIFLLNIESDGDWKDAFQKLTSNTQAEMRSEERAVEITLSDSSIGDYFDVEIMRDSMYGTPTFVTRAGRSKCPHEAGTDAREQFDVQFPSELNELDIVGDKLSKKARSVERQNGAADGDCASFYLELINETPYNDDLELVFDLIPPLASKYGTYDTTGLSLESKIMTTFGTQDMPLLLNDQRRKVRFDICPTGDERDFAAREKRLAGECSDGTKNTEVACTGTWDDDNDVNTDEIPRVWTAGVKDALGNDHSGMLYCNLMVRVSSKCEDQLGNWQQIPKGYLWDSKEMTDVCSASDPVAKRTFPKTAGCWSKELPEVLDGSADISRGLQFGSETPLRREVLIPCLSFHKTKNLCETSPCEGMR